MYLDTVIFVLGREGRERRPLSKGKRPVGGGQAEQGGGGGVMRGGRRDSRAKIGAEVGVKKPP